MKVFESKYDEDKKNNWQKTKLYHVIIKGIKRNKKQNPFEKRTNKKSKSTREKKGSHIGSTFFERRDKSLLLFFFLLIYHPSLFCFFNIMYMYTHTLDSLWNYFYIQSMRYDGLFTSCTLKEIKRVKFHKLWNKNFFFLKPHFTDRMVIFQRKSLERK